jgi:chromosome segregation ATPase
MTPDAFELFSKYWAAPLSNVLLVVVGIALLYPVIWRVTVTQLSDAIKAIEASKSLPKTIADLNDASNGLREVNRELVNLNGQLETKLVSINDSLQVATRQIADLQRAEDERLPPPAPAVPAPQDDAEHWERVSGLWGEVKNEVEERIRNIRDGRFQRKYNSMTRYVYTEIAEYMVKDKLLSQEQAEALTAMDSAFRAIRNRRTTVTPEILQKFEEWRRTILAPSPPPDLGATGPSA